MQTIEFGVGVDAKLKVKVARSGLERMKGLMGTRYVMPDEGMLFVFNMDGYWNMTMVGMLYAIDIVWIDANGFIVDIVEDAQPVRFPKSLTAPQIRPCEKSRYVLELCTGTAKRLNLQMGGQIFDPEVLKV